MAVDNRPRIRMGLWSTKKRIWVTYPYDHKLKEALKAGVQGARWDDTEKFWHFPLDLDVARDIVREAKKFGYGAAVEPELVSWTKSEKTRYSQALAPEATSAEWHNMLPRLRSERPALVKAMEEIAREEDSGEIKEPWQILGANFMVHQRTVLLADQPGLGKTIQTLAAVAELDINGPILVVAPKTAIAATWPSEIAQWLGPDEHIFVVNAAVPPKARRARVQAAKEWADMGGRAWVLCGPNYLRIEADVDEYQNYVRDAKGHKIIRAVRETVPELFGIKWAGVIVDESHQTLAGASGDKKKQSKQRQGLGALDVAPGGLRIAISGTPFRGKTENLWGTLNWLYPEKYTSYWNWIKRHYGMTKSDTGFGSGLAKGDHVLDEKRFFNELRPIMVRRTKQEVRKSLKPKFYGGRHLVPEDDTTPVAVWLEMSTRQAAQYREIERNALINVGTADEITINGFLAEMTRCKQVAVSCLKADGYKADGSDKVVPIFPSNKADWIYDFLDERISAGTKTIVASQFTSFLTILSDELNKQGVAHYLLIGKTTEVQREKIKVEFQKPTGEMVILLNTKSGGTSLTLDLADDCVIVDQTWIPDDQEQVEDRIHRVSRDHQVTIWNLSSLGTIDEDIAVLNNERGEAIISILDRQRGINYVKALVEKMKAKRTELETDTA